MLARTVFSRIAWIGLSVAVATGCSKSSDDPVAAVSNEFSSLPQVTGPVTGTAGASFSSKVSAQAATSGVVLSSPGTFSAGQSVPMCENVNLLKEILREASSPDKILCYMGAMKSAGVIPAAMDLTDGNYKYVKLLNLGNNGGTNSQPVVKFKIVKSGGAIASFEMFSCFSGTTNAPTQSEYISQSFSGETATVVTKNVGTEGASSYGSSMTATGSFSGGSWTSKNVSGFRYYHSGSDTNVMTINMDQYSDELRMSIAMKGGFSGNTFINRFYTVAQLINASSLATLAIGDGSTQANMSFDNASNGVGVDFSTSGTVSWNGDTKAALGTASSGDYYSLAAAGTVPAAPDDTQTVSFSGAQAWDCSLPAGESWTEADFTVGGDTITAGMTACEDKYLSGSWMSCPYQ